MSGCSGRGEAIGHAGELLQGALPIDGRSEPFLITLPAPALRSEARAAVTPGWSVEPDWKTKALRATQLAAAAWGVTAAHRIRIESSIPVARGLGSSTADCVAAVRALASLYGREIRPGEVAALVQAAETACDSTMYDCQPVAFLPRQGKVIEFLAPGWPAIYVTVIDLGGPPVDTLQLPPPVYSPDELAEFAELLSRLRRAFRDRDAELLGQVATCSGEIQQRHQPSAAWNDWRQRLPALGAYGLARAHSGTAAAILASRPLAVDSLSSYRLDCSTARA